MTMFVLALQTVIEWFELRRLQRKKDPYLMGLSLNEPLLKSVFLTFCPSGQAHSWCVRLFESDRDDRTTQKIFSRNVGID